VDAAFRWIGSTRDSRSLPTRTTKPREVSELISDPDFEASELISDPDFNGDLTPAIPADEFQSSSAAPPRRPPLPRSYADFRRDTALNSTRYLHYDVWDLLAPVEFYNAVKDWAWSPETGHTPPVLSPSEFQSAVSDCSLATQAPPVPDPRLMRAHHVLDQRNLLFIIRLPDLHPRTSGTLDDRRRYADCHCSRCWLENGNRSFTSLYSSTRTAPTRLETSTACRPNSTPAPALSMAPNTLGLDPAAKPSCEPDSRLTNHHSRRTVMIRALDPDHLLKHEPPPGPRPLPTKDYDSDDSLANYASTKTRRSRKPRAPSLHYAATVSSFRGGTASNAFCSVRDPLDSEFFATRSIIVGIDSYSDITVAHRDIAYDIRRVSETVHTGAGEATYHEEG
jgi:hypothetical protein